MRLALPLAPARKRWNCVLQPLQGTGRWLNTLGVRNSALCIQLMGLVISRVHVLLPAQRTNVFADIVFLGRVGMLSVLQLTLIFPIPPGEFTAITTSFASILAGIPVAEMVVAVPITSAVVSIAVAEPVVAVPIASTVVPIPVAEPIITVSIAEVAAQVFAVAAQSAFVLADLAAILADVAVTTRVVPVA